MNNTKILIVDDEAKIRNVIKIYLEKEGFSTEEACDGEEALKKFNVSKPSLIY